MVFCFRSRGRRDDQCFLGAKREGTASIEKITDAIIMSETFYVENMFNVATRLILFLFQIFF